MEENRRQLYKTDQRVGADRETTHRSKSQKMKLWRCFVLIILFTCFAVIYFVISDFPLKSAAIPANLNMTSQKQMDVIKKRNFPNVDFGDVDVNKRKLPRVDVDDVTKRKLARDNVDDVTKRTSPPFNSDDVTKRKYLQPLPLIDVDDVMTSLLRRKPCFGQFWSRLVTYQAKHGANQFTRHGDKNVKTRSSYKAYAYSGIDEMTLNMLMMMASAEAATSCVNVSKVNSMCSEKCADGDFGSVSERLACEECKRCRTCFERVQRQICDECVLTKCNNSCTTRDDSSTDTIMGRNGSRCERCIHEMCDNCLRKENDVDQRQKCVENNCANETPPIIDVGKPCRSESHTAISNSNRSRDLGPLRDPRDPSDRRCNCVVMQKPLGRTGNQMFELAATIALAYRHDAIPVLRTEENPLNKLFAFAPDTSACVPAKDLHHFQADVACVYYSHVETLDRKLNWTLEGFLQSWKYFGGPVLEVVIRKLFTPRKGTTMAAEGFVANVSRQGVPNVCLHMRRGDFATKNLEDIGYVTANMTFLNESIEYFKNRYKRVQFIVLSDSIGWCKANILRHRDDVIFSPFSLAGDDMVLMTLCDHVIVTSGTFGWWGGWFSRGTTVYFSGYPRKGSYLDKRFRHEDYYPPTWVPL